MSSLLWSCSHFKFLSILIYRNYTVDNNLIFVFLFFSQLNCYSSLSTRFGIFFDSLFWYYVFFFVFLFFRTSWSIIISISFLCLWLRCWLWEVTSNAFYNNALFFINNIMLLKLAYISKCSLILSNKNFSNKNFGNKI